MYNLSMGVQSSYRAKHLGVCVGLRLTLCPQALPYSVYLIAEGRSLSPQVRDAT